MQDRLDVEWDVCCDWVGKDWKGKCDGWCLPLLSKLHQINTRDNQSIDGSLEGTECDLTRTQIHVWEETFKVSSS